MFMCHYSLNGEVWVTSYCVFHETISMKKKVQFNDMIGLFITFDISIMCITNDIFVILIQISLCW